MNKKKRNLSFSIFSAYGSQQPQTAKKMPKGFFANKNRTLPIAQTADSLYARKTGKVASDVDVGTDEFMTRFGLQAVVKRNQNILKTLVNPSGAVMEINDTYKALAKESAEIYRTYFQELIQQGVPEGIAQSAADEYILPFVEGQLKLMELKYPYTFGQLGASAAVDAAGSHIFSTPQGTSEQSLRSTSVFANVIGTNKYMSGVKKKKKKSKKGLSG